MIRSPKRARLHGWLAAAAIAAAASTSCSSGGSSTVSNDAGAPVCKTGQQACGETCATVATDPDNCGTCGNACATGQVCTAGACAVYCGGGTAKCGTTCVDESADTANCGACGKACASGQACTAGKCVGTCTTEQTLCAATAGGSSFCASTQTDNSNCGACGKVCGAAELCTAGACVTTCATGQSLCTVAAAGSSFCANEQTDNGNCGSCGNVCGAQQLCVAGACQLSCIPSQILCAASDAGAAYCASSQTDNGNCGTCGNVCPSGQSCNGAGTCAETCATGYKVCAGTGTGAAPYCANESVDRVNCGGCGVACAPGQVCEASACVALSLTSLSATSGAAGTSITLTGTGFSTVVTGETVLFGTTPAVITATTATSITVTVPAGIGAVPVGVEIEGIESNTLTFGESVAFAPVPVSPTGCTTANSNTGRKVAVGAAGQLYVGFVCAGGDAYLATSATGSSTFATAAAIPGLTGLSDLALQAGPGNTLYAVGGLGADPGDGITQLVFAVSADGGVTWSAVQTLATGGSQWLSAASFGNDIYAAVGNYDAFANPALGVGMFTSATLPLAPAFADILVDPATGNVWAVSESVTFSVAVSTNNGVTFGAPTALPTTVGCFYSDWAMGNGEILVAGVQDVSGTATNDLYVIPLAAPTAPVTVTGALAGATSLQLAVTADSSGNGYIVGATSEGIQLQQWVMGAANVSAATTITATGTYPVIAPAHGHAVLVAYTDATTGKVQATVQAYP